MVKKLLPKLEQINHTVAAVAEAEHIEVHPDTSSESTWTSSTFRRTAFDGTFGIVHVGASRYPC
eukprot:5991160-Amphidinium_carterae.1